MTKTIKKIAIFRALHLGDLLCSMPAIRLLKQYFPEASVSLIGLKESHFLVNRYTAYIDELIVFPGYPGLPENSTAPVAILDFIDEIRIKAFDLVVQMHGNGSIVNQLLLFSGAKYLWAFCKEGAEEPLHFSKTISSTLDWPEITWMTYPENMHEIHRHLSLIKYGIEQFNGEAVAEVAGDDELFFPFFKEDYGRYTALKLPIEMDQFVIVHAGSRGSYRRWPVNYFAKVSQYCLDLGFKVVLTGTENECETVHKVQDLVAGETLNLAGKTDLGTLGVLIENAAFVFSNCTGISHLAAALKKEAIIISMDGEPERWGPLDRSKIYTHDWLHDKALAPIFKVLEAKLKSITVRNSRAFKASI